MTCTKIAVAGTSSEVGKTTLMCDLLQALPGWEAIKMTRGHYRSCGKDPHACCVSHLLADEPLVRSGFLQTYASGKDTGRYWDAGASNVHWVVVTDDQVERGIGMALDRVKAPGVLIEGNSFLRYIDVDYAVLVASDAMGKNTAKIKGSTNWAYRIASALYVFDRANTNGEPSAIATRLKARYAPLKLDRDVTEYGTRDLAKLVARVKRVHSTRSRAVAA
jgi:hypothetical protein